MCQMVKDKVCLVTGAGKGIGKSIAETLALNGAIVYAIERSEGDVALWSNNILSKHMIIPITADITEYSSVKAAILRIKKEQGRIDVIVNNAGVEFNERIGMISDAHMKLMFEVNVYAMVNIIQLCSRIMMRQKNTSSIINISSGVGINGNAGQLAYSATKGAVIALTKSAAKELGKFNIRVNSIAPGLTKTRMMENVEQEQIQSRIDKISMGRIAQPQDIANAVLFLASDLSSYISGQIISVDGCSN